MIERKFSEAAGNVLVAEVLAHDGAILAFDQGVIVAVAGAGFDQFDAQLLEQGGNAVVAETTTAGPSCKAPATSVG